MKIVTLFTAQGQMIGELIAEHPSYVLRNPMLVVPSERGVNFVPMLNLSEDKDAVIASANLVFANTFQPVSQLADKYREIVSGIQIVSKPSILMG